jgi:hypothetical protein
MAERRAIEELTGRAGVVVACERGHWRVFNWGCANEVVGDGAQLHYDSQVKELAAMGVQSIKVVFAGGCLVYAFGDVNSKSGGNLVATVGGKSQLLWWGTRTPT